MDSNLFSAWGHAEDSQPQKLSNAGFGIRINLDHFCAELVHFSSGFSR